MLLAKFFVVILSMVGVFGTFIHKIPGTPLIFLAAAGYGAVFGFNMLWIGVLLALTVFAETGSLYIRERLLPEPGINKALGLDVAAGSFASLVITDVLAGPLFGLIIWDLLIGKSIMPMLIKSGHLVAKLFAAAMLRFTVAWVMVAIVVFKIL